MSRLTHRVRLDRKTKGSAFFALIVSLGISMSADAQDHNEKFELNSFGDIRLRYHRIDQDAFQQPADALSLRIKAGLEFNLFENSTFLIELEGSENIVENFNDTINGQINRPVIADPSNFDINRLQFQTELIPNTRLTIGRQTIALDDWRFIGQWNFRQNEQSFDAVRVETKIGSGLLNAAYIGGVERQLGNNSPVGEFNGDSVLLNYGLPTPAGRLTAFYYGLDLNTEALPDGPSNLSTATAGVRLNGRYKWTDWGLNWDGSIARQTDFANNPNDYSALYASARLGAEYRNFELAAKGEWLGSDNGQAVQTPLGTLHRLNGYADQFLTTPDEGLRDLSISAIYKFRDIGIFEDVHLKARHHWFDSDTLNRNFGSEIDVGLSGKWKSIRFGLEYANYTANEFSSDTQAFILSTEFNFD